MVGFTKFTPELGPVTLQHRRSISKKETMNCVSECKWKGHQRGCCELELFYSGTINNESEV